MISFNVPNLPGVPNVLRSVLSGNPQPELLFKDALTGLLGGAGGMFAESGSQWGIFKNGQQVVQAESVVSLDLKKDWSLSDYPVEKGGFADYDKVTLPFQARIRFASGSDSGTRQALLDSIDSIAGDLEMYDVISAEKVYSNVNINSYDMRREATRGVGLIQIDVQVTEVRETAVPTNGSATAEADGAGEKNGGTVQGKEASTADREAVTGEKSSPDTTSTTKSSGQYTPAYVAPDRNYAMPGTPNPATSQMARSYPMLSSTSFTPAVQSSGTLVQIGGIGGSFGLRAVARARAQARE